MDKIECGASYPQNDAFADDSDKEDYVYSTESSDDNDVGEIKTNEQQKGVIIGGESGDMDKVYDFDDDNIIQDDGLDREEKKKRKLETLLSRYELAPRAVETPPVPKRSRAGRNSLTDWTEQESFVLLEAWGERYLKHGRKNVREWHEVAQKVSEGPKIKRTETQCRNRLDTLKKRYKKEKAMLAENMGGTSQWVFFSKMDMILSPSSNVGNGYVSVEPKVEPNQVSHKENGNVLVEQKVEPNHDSKLANGYVSVEPKVHSSNASSSDEIKDDSLIGDSEFVVKEKRENAEDVPPKRAKKDRERGLGDAFKLLADSIGKFRETYERVQSEKSKKLVEMEKMKMKFKSDTEIEKNKIMKKAHIEIVKLWGLTSKDLEDPSPGNASG